ncbi:MAG: hypothetical protein IH988_00570 [Planctomycetes bacterium]|nr:hypothetical protein [Planctomycetota bacterium]
MREKLLEEIGSLEFEAALVASTPAVLRELLRRHQTVRALRDQYYQGLLPDELLRDFVNGLLTAGAGEDPFPYQAALSAIAVLLEPWFTSLAEEYLRDLARIQSGRFYIASRVARECLREREHAPTTELRVYGKTRPHSNEPLQVQWDVRPVEAVPPSDGACPNTIRVA